jgi:c-di-GMP-binding flagellar brake protein YcgR
MQENRKFHRYLLSIDIGYCKENTKKEDTSKTKNVSAGGVCITTSAGPLERGAVYVLSFQLPDSREAVTVKARVVWTKKDDQHQALFDNGLEFINMREKYREAIEEYSIGSVIEK